MIDRALALIKRHAGREEQVSPDMLLEEELDFDSLDNWELAFGLEDEFNIEISDHDVNQWLTVQDVIDTVNGSA